MGLFVTPTTRTRFVSGDLGAALEYVGGRLGGRTPRIAIVLGSGLGALAESLVDAESIPYSSIPAFPETTVAGHRGEIVLGDLSGVPLILQRGRFHLYEGHDPSVVALPVRLFAELGVKVVIFTNAAGGLNPQFRPPTLMLIADHLNLMWRNPLIGRKLCGEARWPDLLDCYDFGLRNIARDVARDSGIQLDEGVYSAVLGPSFETPAETRMLRALGADAVGMSTVPEVLAARARRMRVLGISSITNLGAGLAKTSLSHDEVLRAGASVAGELAALVRGVVNRLEDAN